MLESAENGKRPQNDQPSFRVRLSYVVYAVALLASAISAFGGAGVVVGAIVLAAWGLVFVGRLRSTAFLCALTGVVFLELSLLPAVCSARSVDQRSGCRNFLKQIGLALHAYHDTYGTFPPRVSRTRQGEFEHSWRVLLLPFLDQQALYDAYNFDEPWDGPNNRKLLGKMPAVYGCPEVSARGGRGWTDYVAVTGDSTAWPETGLMAYSDFPDGMSNTIMVVEFTSSGIPWTEPRDLRFDDAIRSFTSSDPDDWHGHPRHAYFREYFDGRDVLMADGAARFFSHGHSTELWTALLTPADGRPESGDWDLELESPRPFVRTRPRIGNYVRFAVFVVLALWPLPWAFRRPVSAGRVPPD